MQNNATVKSIIKAYKDNLPKHWVEGWLLHVLQQSNVFLITNSGYILTDDEQAQFNDGIKQMQAGTPLAYLVGYQEFWSLKFQVNEHTLIPRPDTEVLVETVLQWIEDKDKSLNMDDKKQPSIMTSKRLLDLGTGSGCIAISMAYELNQSYPDIWRVTAVDISIEALKVATENALLNQVENVEFVQSSWFNSLEVSAKNKFEVIVSNPPYIVADDTHLTELVAEPLSALVATDEGLADIRHIVSQAGCYLVSKGLLAIEHGHDQGRAVREIFRRVGFDSVETFKDYGSNERVTMGVYY